MYIYIKYIILLFPTQLIFEYILVIVNPNPMYNIVSNSNCRTMTVEEISRML